MLYNVQWAPSHVVSLAQLVERRSHNPEVVGSIPTGGNIFGLCVLCFGARDVSHPFKCLGELIPERGEDILVITPFSPLIDYHTSIVQLYLTKFRSCHENDHHLSRFLLMILPTIYVYALLDTFRFQVMEMLTSCPETCLPLNCLR